MEFFYEIMWSIKKLFRTLYYNVKYGMKNLWKWRKIVWNDRPWDYVYILHALRFKLDDIQYCIDGTFVGSEEEAAKIREVIFALDRIIDDNYVEEEYTKMDEKYGKIKMIFNDDNTINVTRENLKDEDKVLEKKETLEIAELEADRRQKDINFVFDVMKKDIQKWWV